jgi:hypothetical protein
MAKTNPNKEQMKALKSRIDAATKRVKRRIAMLNQVKPADAMELETIRLEIESLTENAAKMRASNYGIKQGETKEVYEQRKYYSRLGALRTVESNLPAIESRYVKGETREEHAARILKAKQMIVAKYQVKWAQSGVRTSYMSEAEVRAMYAVTSHVWRGTQDVNARLDKIMTYYGEDTLDELLEKMRLSPIFRAAVADMQDYRPGKADSPIVGDLTKADLADAAREAEEKSIGIVTNKDI